MRIVIIGAGPAGVSVVETVRARSFDHEIVMLSAEPYLPYSPPAMMDHFLNGTESHLWCDQRWIDRMKVEYRAGSGVVAVDTTSRAVALSNGARIDYDKLVIASGGSLHASLPGSTLPGVYNFKSLSAAESLFAEISEGRAARAVIVGGGFIGVEIALLLRLLDLEVVVIEMLDQVMSIALDEGTSRVVVSLMREQGIWVVLNTEASRFVGTERVTGVEMTSGMVLDGDVFVASTSIRPQIEYLEGSGVERSWGVIVDRHLRTNVDDVYAAGDVAEASARSSGESLVQANFPNAITQGRVVGQNLLGKDVVYEGTERMNSLLHLGLPIVVFGSKEGDEVLQSRASDTLRTFYLKEGRLVGFQLVGDIRGAGYLRTLANQGTSVACDKDKLLERPFGQGAFISNIPT